MEKTQLELKKINLEDERFRTSYHFSLQKLKLSLKEIGLLNPPIVTSRDNKLILVSGWKRIQACFELFFTSIPVYIIEGKSDLKTFLMAFYENLATRELDLMEKAEILVRLKKFGEDEKKIVKHYLSLLDIPQSLSHLDTYLAFSRFEPEVKRAAYEKNMSFPALKILAGFKPQEQRFLLPVLLPLGQNKQKEILEDLLEVSKRLNKPVRNILHSKEISTILAGKKLTPLQKADKTRLLLREKRYPVFSSWKESFDSLLKEMKWPKEIIISPSPFFEEDDFTVIFSFEDQEQFKNNLSKLKELSSKEEFSEFFKLK